MNTSIRLPSLGVLVDQAVAALGRFPFVLAAGVVCAVTAMLLANEPEHADPLWRLLASASLGLPLFTATAITAERRPGWAAQLAGGAVGIAILALYYAGWSGWPDPQRVLRYVQLSAAFHLLVAVLPFVGRPRQRQAFWQYNRLVLERVLVAALFAVIIYGGLALALAAVDKLLGVSIEPQAYARVWFTIAFVVATWIFLAGVPKDLPALEGLTEYPAPLKLLAQRVLVPLISLYIIILTLYLFRVIATRVWPSGWIGWLVTALGVTGTFALLIVQPLARHETEGWIAKFARVYWIAVMPAVVMLWLALRQRVLQYGFTEPRYFLLVVSVWLFGLALYYTIRRSQDMRVIPASLAALGVITLVGPWGAYSISRHSQFDRLERILESEGMLAAGRLQAPTHEVQERDRREVPAVLEYLLTNHGSAAVLQWFTAGGVTVDTSLLSGGTSTAGRNLAKLLGVPPPQLGLDRGGFFARDGAAIDVRGYDVFIPVIIASRSHPDSSFAARFDRAAQVLEVLHGDSILLTIAVDSLMREAARDTVRERSAPIFLQRGNDRWDARVRITRLLPSDSVGVIRVVGGSVLLKRRR